MSVAIHHRDTEFSEVAQRIELLKPLCDLCALRVSVVKIKLLYTQTSPIPLMMRLSFERA
jgi:hypothetical protein